MNKTTIAWCHGMSAPCDECDGETVVGREAEVHQSRLFRRPSVEECQPCGGSGKILRHGYTWNPTRGCSAVSPGCLNCYAGTSATRFSGPGLYAEAYVERHRTGRGGAAWTGKVDLMSHKLADPLRVRKPGAVFVNSMSDLFHEELTFEEISAVVGVMAASPQHLFMSLTKRAKRMREWFEWIGGENHPADVCYHHARHILRMNSLPGKSIRDAFYGLEPAWPLPNWRIGVSAEDQQRWDERVPELLRCPAAFRFTSCEPLLGPIEVRSGCWQLKGIDQIIVGSESGAGARPMDLDWARSIRDQCQAAGVAFFMKQISTAKGRKLGIEHFPEDLQIQEVAP